MNLNPDQWVASLALVLRRLWFKLSAHDLLIAIVLTLTLFIGASFIGYENNKIVPLNVDPNAHYLAEPGQKVSFLSNWDGPNYLRIAQYGYTSPDEANFFPVYPAVVRVVETVVRSYLISGIIVAWAAACGAAYYVIKILKQLYDHVDTADTVRGLGFFLLFPSSVFLLATYTESLLCFFALGALYYALKKQFLSAAIFLVLATATHITGIFVVILVCLVLIEQKETIRNVCYSAALGCVGLASYMIYQAVHVGSPLAFITSQKGHGWLTSHVPPHTVNSIGWLNLVFVLFILITALYWWQRRRSFSIFSLLYLAIPIVGGQFGGFNRYVLIDFPMQLMAFEVTRKRPALYTLTVAGSVILWSYFLFQYVGGYVGG